MPIRNPLCHIIPGAPFCKWYPPHPPKRNWPFKRFWSHGYDGSQNQDCCRDTPPGPPGS